MLPGLGGYQLKELTPEVVSEFRAMLADKGVGDATIRKAMFTLQSAWASPSYMAGSRPTRSRR